MMFSEDKNTLRSSTVMFSEDKNSIRSPNGHISKPTFARSVKRVRKREGEKVSENKERREQIAYLV